MLYRYSKIGVKARAAAILLSFLMTVGLVAPGAYALPEAPARPVLGSNQINEMLKGREYVEGDAIVVAEKGFKPASFINGESEKLAEADEESLALTADAARESENDTHMIMAERADASSASSYTISVVHSDNMNTAELIRKLYTSPKVISAEPNYLTSAGEAYAVEEGAATGTEGETPSEEDTTSEDADTSEDEGNQNGEVATEEESSQEEETIAEEQTSSEDNSENEDQSESPGLLKAPALRYNQNSWRTFGEHDPEVGDLSSAQWYLGDGGGSNAIEGDAKAGFGMDLPGYEGKGKGAINSEPGATIAIVDSGMDVDHPDLSNRFYEFSEAQQKKYGCGVHGLNATVEPGSKNSGDLTDTVDHGTHVTGIMGANWNGKGVSGVANGAKLVGVRLSDDTGNQSAEGNIRGFNFLINCAQDINLKSANCSWGSDTGVIEFTYTLMVNELGRHGVITVFAAGNSNLDMDQKIETSSYIDSPYLLVVNAMTPSGTRAGFSNYGQTQTDVFAPGANIMSTVPAKVIEIDPAEEEIPIVYNRLHPEGGQADTLITDESGFKKVKIYSENPFLHPDATTVKFEIANTGTSDRSSIKIKRTDFKEPEEEAPDDADWGARDSVFMKIPVGDMSAGDIELISIRAAADFGMSSILCRPFGFAANTADGVKMVSFERDSKRYYDAATARGSANAWGTATANVGYMLDQYKDEGVESIHIDDNNCITLWIDMNEDRADDQKTDAVYLDDIALGGNSAHAGAHIVFNGTSMAAPAVTAALGVVAKDETPNNEFKPGEGEGTLGMQALKRSARLRAATKRTAYFKKLCATGGFVRLTAFKNIDSTENAPLAPIIASVTSDKKSKKIEVKGWFFGGSKGISDISVDGFKAGVVSWTDEKIVINLPSSVGNGAHALRVETKSAAKAGVDSAAFSTSYDSPEKKTGLYEHELSVPDMTVADEEGKTSKLYPCMVASGDYIYTLQRGLVTDMVAVWRYHIPSDKWEMIDMPSEKEMHARSGSIMAKTPNGIVLLASEQVGTDEYDVPIMKEFLYYYDVAGNKWSRKNLPHDDVPVGAIFTRGKDLYFMGIGGELTVKGKKRTSVLEVLRDGKSKTEVLGTIPVNYDHMSFLSGGIVADCGRYVYVSGQEPLGGTYPLSWAITRFKLDKNDKVTERKEFYYELADAGIIKEGIWDSTIAMASIGCGIAVINRETEGTDTMLLENGSTKFTEYSRTSSFYHGNSQMAAYSNGRLYVFGFSPSEPGKVFFRATDVGIDHSWDNGKVTRKPTPDRPGIRTYTCTRCGKTRTEEIPYVAPEEISYSCVHGDGSTWTRGSGKSLEFRFKRSPVDEAYERYEMIRVDGEELAGSDYSISKGSLIVNLKSSYLKELSLGEHEIEVEFNDGKASASFTIVKGKTKTIKTGDNTPAGLWLMISAICAAALLSIIIRRTRQGSGADACR